MSTPPTLTREVNHMDELPELVCENTTQVLQEEICTVKGLQQQEEICTVKGLQQPVISANQKFEFGLKESTQMLVGNESTSDNISAAECQSGSESRDGYYTETNEAVVSHCNEVDRLIRNSLVDIEEQNGMLRGLRQLSIDRKEQVKLFCEDLQEEWEEQNDELDSTTVNEENEAEAEPENHRVDKEERKKKLQRNFVDKICDYLQDQLNTTFNMREDDLRDEQLADVIFYYLMKGERPDEPTQKIIYRLFVPLYDHIIEYRDWNYSWFEICCIVLRTDLTFAQFYKRLYNNRTALEYLKQPELLLNRTSGLLIERLVEPLPYENLHQTLTNIRDNQGHTYMFYIDFGGEVFVKLYRNHIKDLYDLLSICDRSGQTALHVNTYSITFLLSQVYTPRQRHLLIKLTSIVDNNNQTAVQAASSGIDELTSLISRAEKNEYVLTNFDTKILIICNTNFRRGAEEEAQEIYDSCNSTYGSKYITLEKDKTESEIIELVRQSATMKLSSSLPTSLVVILASHGGIGVIDDCDGNPINLSSIEAVMCHDVLAGKPKMLITQCCQNTAPVANKKDKPYAPIHNDFCAVMSSVPGGKSARGVFLGKIAAQIKDSSIDTNIFQIVNRVSTEMEREEHQQTPIIMSTLKAEFCPADNWFRRKDIKH